MYPFCKMNWLRQERPAFSAQASRFVAAKEYVFQKMTGQQVVDYVVASGSGLLNVRTLQPNARSLAIAGIRGNSLEPLSRPLTKFRGTDATLAQPTGIAPQTLVMLGASEAANSKVGAGAAGVMLALENWDIRIDSLRLARQYVDSFHSPWFQLCVDIGNLAYAGDGVVGELEANRGHIAAVHFTDTLRGQLRYVPLGEGEVSFVAACAKLVELGFQGPAVIELWTEACPNALEIVTRANRRLRARIAEGWQSNQSQSRAKVP